MILPHDNQQDTGEKRKRWRWAIKSKCQRLRCGEPVNGFLQVKELDVEEQPLNLPALKGRSETGNGKTACLEAQIKLTKEVPMGMLYKRGAAFWIKYYLNGRPIRASTRTPKQKEAERFLKDREDRIVMGMPALPKLERIWFADVADALTEHYRITCTRRHKDM